jgi:rSAM/selenodomain-associated transferase 1
MSAAIAVLAKWPEPGRVKTRLCPPCTPEDAAVLAEAALCDTLYAVGATSATRHVLALDRLPGPGVTHTHGFEVIPQRGAHLGARLTGVFEDVRGPALVLGMDTPQVTRSLLDRALAALERADVDVVLGPAEDGGFWTIGLRVADRRVFERVPMSTARTGRLQRARLRELGLRTAMLPTLRDVDSFDDAVAVSQLAPNSKFARALRALHSDVVAAAS